MPNTLNPILPASSSSTTVFNPNSIKKEFDEVKQTYHKCTAALLGVSAIGLLAGSTKKGGDFSAKSLRVVGDAFGSVAAIFTPFILAKNEKNDYEHLKHGKRSGTSSLMNNMNELFYRCVSVGFLPYVFETLINPKNIFRSKASMFASAVNIPNIIFTGLTFGLGNINSVIAWGLKSKQQFSLDREISSAKSKLDIKEEDSIDIEKLVADLREKGEDTTALEESYKKTKSYERLYGSIKRVVTLGSIALPAMHGLRRWAESFDFFFNKEMSLKEYAGKPLLGFSRIVSFGIGIPETFAKGFDSIARVVQEKDHLKPALPEFVNKPLDKFADFFDSQVSENSKSPIKALRHASEIVFHTLSPLSQAAFIAPIIHKPALNEDAQAEGGAASKLDKVFGIYGKSLLQLFTIPYVVVSRVPQTIAQVLFFAKYFAGKGRKGDQTKQSIENVQEKICNNKLIKGVSSKVQSMIKYLVPDYYESEHMYGFPNFEQIQANDSFDQASEKFKEILQPGVDLGDEQRSEVVEYCLNYVEKSAARAYEKLDTKELEDIKAKINEKIDKTISVDSSSSKRRTDIKFPGANLIAGFLRPFDFVSRLKALSSKSPFHRMETAYKIDEIPAFEREFLIVLGECASSGLTNTINRLQGIAIPEHEY